MPFSLYGDLPEPSSDKTNNVKNTPTTTGSSLSGLYASLPAPGASSSATAATTTTTTTANTTPSPTTSTTTAATQPASETTNNTPTSSPAPTTGVKPAGWSSFGHFRPVMRKPTIQAKPKLNRTVIPAGAKVVSTTTVSKDPSKMEQDAAASTLSLPPPPPPSSSNPIEDTIPSLPRRLDASYFTATDDVNGFRAKKKGKGKKGNQQQQQQPIAIDLNEDYDPLRPNDYEQYKEDRRQHKEEVKRRQMEERRNRQRQRSMSPYSSDSRSRSRSRSRSPSPRRPARAFAPPPNLYQRSHSPSPPPPASRRSPSPPPSERIQHKANIDLNESADDAYMRRLRMSSQRAAVAQHQEDDPRNDRMPMDEDDENMAMRTGLGGAQDVARKVMAKYGWQEGQGLGRDEDGLREALKVQPTGRGSGVIVNQSHTSSVSPSPPPHQPRTSTPSPVVLLTNMVGPGEVDDMLQEETADECGKYGQVERCLIFEVPGGQVPEDQAVRIFVKFTRVESAMAALNDLNGRFFGGRVVTARFFDNNRFDRLDLAPGPNEI